MSACHLLCHQPCAEKSPNGTCVLDTDCQAGNFCSGDSVRPICRCMNGLDSCDTLATCQAIPVVSAAPVDTRTDCEKCSDCVRIVQDWATTNAVSTNESLVIANRFVQRCTTNFTAGDVLKCKYLAGAVAFSYNGNLAKRAGAICSRLGNCSATAALATCNVTGVARLDMCTQEGYAGGSALPLPTAGVLFF